MTKRVDHGQPVDSDGLTEMQRRFVNAYAGEACGNGQRAAELAGHTGSYYVRAQWASTTLKKVEIQAILRTLQESDPLVASREERLRFLTRMMRGEVADQKLTDDGLVEVRAPAAARLQAEKQLAVAAGEYVQKHELKVEGDLEKLTTKELAAKLAELQEGERAR